MLDYMKQLKVFSVLILLLLPIEILAFGNEYVHIKVHVPKDQAPSIAIDAEPAPPHKVIHHFHHHGPPHQRSRGRSPPKLKSSPLLESVILSDLDKPSHTNEHSDYLNHAKELAEHLSESYALKKPPPPPPPKKKVNTFTIIEEKHRPNSYEYEAPPEHNVDTYRVIDTRPQQHSHHHSHQAHYQPDDADDDIGYHYVAPVRQHRHKPASTSTYHVGDYAEPAPVEEPSDSDLGYSYTPPAYAAKSARAPAHTLEVPEETLSDNAYQYYGSGSSDASASGSGFIPSPQLISHTDGYEDEHDTYGAPIATRRRRLGVSHSRANAAYSAGVVNKYNSVDSYKMGRGGYKYSGPYL